MKKQIRLIVILAVVLLVLVLSNSLIKKLTKSKEVETTDDTIYVTDLDIVTELSFNDLDFVYSDNNEWTYPADSDFPLNSAKIDTIINYIKGMTSDRILSDGDTLENYGLAEPQYTFTIADKNGNKDVIKIGNECASGDGYYVMKNDDEKNIYRSTVSFTSYLEYSLIDFMEIVDINHSYATLASKVVISHDGEEYTYTAEDDNFSDIVDDLEFTYSAGTAYNPTAEDLTKYGFDSPLYKITISYLDTDENEQELTIEIGMLKDDGDYTVRSSQSENIYSCTSSFINSIEGIINPVTEEETTSE